MPELAASFFVGFLLSLTANISHYFLVVRSFQNSQILILQNNLNKIGKIWSVNNRAVITVVEPEKIPTALESDRRRTLKSTGLFSVMLVVTSWFGLIWLGLYLLSVHRIAKSRMEHKIFSSQLVSNKSLTNLQVSEILTEIESDQ